MSLHSRFTCFMFHLLPPKRQRNTSTQQYKQGDLSSLLYVRLGSRVVRTANTYERYLSAVQYFLFRQYRPSSNVQPRASSRARYASVACKMYVSDTICISICYSERNSVLYIYCTYTRTGERNSTNCCIRGTPSGMPSL